MIARKKKQGLPLWLRRIMIAAEILILTPLLLLLISNQIIRLASEKQLYSAVEEIPHNTVGLVLGTSHRVRNGGPNPYFNNRMEAAAQLYHSGKVEYLIVSGDNRTPYYNEPEQMLKALIQLGVPAEIIYQDHAGLRTLDSVIRAREVFGQHSITIVSQRFHNQRAVYIAQRNGMEAVALNAEDAPQGNKDKTLLREWFAKANVFWDMSTGKQPQIVDEKVSIGT